MSDDCYETRQMTEASELIHWALMNVGEEANEEELANVWTLYKAWKERNHIEPTPEYWEGKR